MNERPEPPPTDGTKQDNPPALRAQAAGGSGDDKAAPAGPLPDGIFVSDASGLYVEVNEAGCRMFQRSREEILGRSALDFVTPEQASLLQAHLVSLKERGGERFELVLQRPDGSKLPLEIHSATLPGGYRHSVVRDLSAQKAQEHERAITAEAMERLHAISTLFLQGLTDDTVLAAILDAAITICESDCGIVRVLDGSTGELRIVAQKGLPAFWVEYWDRILRGQGPCGTALAQGERIIIEDVEQSALFVGTPALDVQRKAGVRAVQSTPLFGRSGEPLGIISTHYKTPRQPAEYALRLLDLLARHAADLLEHRRIEDQLRRAEAKSTGILAASPDAIISIEPSGTITEWNYSAERMFGYSRAEVLGTMLDKLLPEMHRAAHREHIALFASQSGPGRRMDHQTAVGLRKNGQVFPIDAVISMVKVGTEQILTVAVRDITAQKRVENEHRLLAEVGGVLSSLGGPESLRRIPALAVSLIADCAVLFSSSGSGEPLIRIASASRDPSLAWAAEHMMEAPLKHRTEHPVWRAVLEQRSIIAELDPAQYEHMAQSPEHLRALRAVAPRSALVVPLCVGGRCLGALGFCSTARGFDAQDLHLVEEVARRCSLYIENARLHHAEKQALRARDEVLGIVAHDLRNPLNAIHLQLQLLLRRRTDPADRWKEPAENIRSATQRMNRLIQDLLDVTRLEAGALSVDLARLAPDRLITEVVESQRALAAAASIELRSETDPDLPMIQADRGRIQQAFENLLGNAFKFTAPGGKVTVGAQALDRELLFRVSDTGTGISPEHQAHLFDRFWQAKRADQRGVGLGLAIVKGIVTAHGGRIWLESAVGRGTTFFFTLPFAAAAKH